MSFGPCPSSAAAIGPPNSDEDQEDDEDAARHCHLVAAEADPDLLPEAAGEDGFETCAELGGRALLREHLGVHAATVTRVVFAGR